MVIQLVIQRFSVLIPIDSHFDDVLMMFWSTAQTQIHASEIFAKQQTKKCPADVQSFDLAAAPRDSRHESPVGGRMQMFQLVNLERVANVLQILQEALDSFHQICKALEIQRS